MKLPLDAILNSLEDAVLCVDAEATVLWFNEAAARLFDCAATVLPSARASQPASLAGAVRELGVSEVAHTGRAVRQILLPQPSGEPIALEAIVSPLLVGATTVYTALFRDVSLLLRMERVVFESRKTQALASLSGGIAHDFNNILTAVICQIDLAITTPGFPASLREFLINAQTSARRGAELVSRLELFSRNRKPEFAPLDLTIVIDQVVFMLRRSVDPQVTLHFTPPAGSPWLARADAQQMMQALLNLSVNARDAMPTGGRLSFELRNVKFAATGTEPPRRAGEFVALSVSDTGIGMTPDVAARVFEPYFTTKDPSKGPGLGLSITAAVVAEHGGWVEVESKPGAGSRFCIYLPRTLDSVTAETPAPVADAKAGEGNECLLVVDDEELVRMVTKAVLAYRGYRVVEAHDGQEAVEMYAAQPGAFDLILMDVSMPRLNGHDALLKIRELNSQSKVILLSGGVQEPDTALDDPDITAFLHKPFDNQELVRLVRQLLDQRPGSSGRA